MYNMKVDMTTRYEQRLPKVCLAPHKQVDRNIYNPAKIRKILESHNVTGVKQVYIPNKQQDLAYGSIIFRTPEDRNAFIKRFADGLPLTQIATDLLTVDQWYSSDEREQHRVRQSLSKSRGFFCSNVPKNLTRQDLLDQLPNSQAIAFVKIMVNINNKNMMASFCYNNVSDAAEFVTLCSTGVLRLTVDNVVHDIHVEPFRNNQRPVKSSSYTHTTSDNDSDSSSVGECENTESVHETASAISSQC